MFESIFEGRSTLQKLMMIKTLLNKRKTTKENTKPAEAERT